jgi:WD40 repeat protein
MLNKSNILALVGGGKTPQFSKNKIIILDDHQGKIIRQIRFNSNVLKVKIRPDSIIGIVENKIYIIHIDTLETIDILDTSNNPHNIFSISNSIINELIIAFPHPKNKGKVQIENYNFFNLKEDYKKDETKIISAHESNIAYLVLNNEGTILATASDKGTLFRLFNVSTGEMITELRRGAKNAKINCLAFNSTSELFGCTSDIGTVHIFDIHDVNKILEIEENKKNNNNDNNKKEKSKKYANIKINERSFAKYKLGEEKGILGFTPKNELIVMTPQAKIYNTLYDVKNWEKNKSQIESSFIKVSNE